MNNVVRTQIEIAQLSIGMTVELDGIFYTVGKGDVKFNDLFGRHSFRGDMSKTTITRIQFAVPTAFGLTLR